MVHVCVCDNIVGTLPHVLLPTKILSSACRIFWVSQGRRSTMPWRHLTRLDLE